MNRSSRQRLLFEYGFPAALPLDVVLVVQNNPSVSTLTASLSQAGPDGLFLATAAAIAAAGIKRAWRPRSLALLHLALSQRDAQCPRSAPLPLFLRALSRCRQHRMPLRFIGHSTDSCPYGN